VKYCKACENKLIKIVLNCIYVASVLILGISVVFRVSDYGSPLRSDLC